MPKQAEIRCTRCGNLLPSPEAPCLCAQSNYPRPEPPKFGLKKFTEEEKRNNSAKAGMFLGFACFIAPLVGIGGFGILIGAFVASIKGLNSDLRKQAKLGLILASIATTMWLILGI